MYDIRNLPKFYPRRGDTFILVEVDDFEVDEQMYLLNKRCIIVSIYDKEDYDNEYMQEIYELIDTNGCIHHLHADGLNFKCFRSTDRRI